MCLAHRRKTTFWASAAATWTEYCWRSPLRSQTFWLSPRRWASRCPNQAYPRQPASPRCPYAGCMSSNNKVPPVCCSRIGKSIIVSGRVQNLTHMSMYIEKHSPDWHPGPKTRAPPRTVGHKRRSDSATCQSCSSLKSAQTRLDVCRKSILPIGGHNWPEPR